MSAALQLTTMWGEAARQTAWPAQKQTSTTADDPAPAVPSIARAEPVESLAFYRKHTENMLRRYLYASMQVGRAPSLLGDSVGRGWVSSRPIRTFEDAVIFVLDVERCLSRLNAFDRQLLSRLVLQEYTQAETAELLGMGVRAISYKYPVALDRLTKLLLEAGLLVLPH